MLPAGGLYALVGGLIWAKGTASAKEAMSVNPKAKKLYLFNQIYPLFWVTLILYCLWQWLIDTSKHT